MSYPGHCLFSFFFFCGGVGEWELPLCRENNQRILAGLKQRSDEDMTPLLSKWGCLPLCRCVLGVFYRPSRLGLFSYLYTSKKCINSTLTCEAYSSFKGMSFDQRIVTAKKHLSLRRNAAKRTTTSHYNGPLLYIRDISNEYTITLRYKFNALQEISDAHIEVKAECVPTKLRAKHRILRKILAVKKIETMWKAYPYAIWETQLIPTLRNLKTNKEN